MAQNASAPARWSHGGNPSTATAHNTKVFDRGKHTTLFTTEITTTRSGWTCPGTTSDNGPMADDAIDPVFQDDAESGYYLTDLKPDTTGLPFALWIAVCAGVSHDVRVWAHRDVRSVPTERTCLAIRPEVRVLKGEMNEKDLALLKKWVALNEPMLDRHWNGDSSSGEAIDRTLAVTGKQS